MATATAMSANRNAWWKLSQLAPAAHPAPAKTKHQMAEPIRVRIDVAPERDLEDPGRDRDERPHDRRQPPEQDGPVLPALEPRLGALELRVVEMQPAAVLFEVGPPAAAPDLPPDHGADQVPDRPGRDDREIGREARRERVAE